MNLEGAREIVRVDLIKIKWIHILGKQIRRKKLAWLPVPVSKHREADVGRSQELTGQAALPKMVAPTSVKEPFAKS